MRPIALLLTCCFFGVTSLSGATVHGKVSDEFGDVLANAQVQLANTATNAFFVARSSHSGEYAVESLPAGTYVMVVTVPGMDAYRQLGITLGVEQTLEVNPRVPYGISLNTVGEDRDLIAQKRSVHPVPAGPAPRLPNGSPDLSGMWHPQRVTATTPQTPLPWTQRLIEERRENRFRDYPLTRCLPGGPTLFTFIDFYRILQTPTHLVMINENDVPGFRQVYLDGRQHPSDLNPTWMGHSVGRWDGDTLVVDTVGLNDKTWLDMIVSPHTENLHLIEKYRRPDLGHLEVEITIDDPGAYAKPWTVTRVSDLAPGEDVMEFVCTENNRDPEHMVGR